MQPIIITYSRRYCGKRCLMVRVESCDFLRWYSSEIPRPRLCEHQAQAHDAFVARLGPCAAVGGEELGCRRSGTLGLNPHGWRCRSRSLLAFDKLFANPDGGIWGRNSEVLVGPGEGGERRCSSAAGSNGAKTRRSRGSNFEGSKGSSD